MTYHHALNVMKISKLKYGSCLALFLFCTQVAYSLESRTQEEANLKKAIYCMEILENSPDLSTDTKIAILKNECFDKEYIQHSPHVKDGREEVLNVFRNRFEKYPNISSSIKRSAASEDLVWLHQHVKRTEDDLGTAVVNIFRMKNGKFVEHWNVVQRVPEISKNQNTMF